MRNEYGVTLDGNGYAPSIVDYYSAVNKRCFECDWTQDLVRHEVFNASNRKKSKAYGLWVYLCPRCHMEIHDHPDKARHLKKIAQRQAMAWYKWDIDEWRERFGKNYLDELL